MSLDKLPPEIFAEIMKLVPPNDYFSRVPLLSKELKEQTGQLQLSCEEILGPQRRNCYKLSNSNYPNFAGLEQRCREHCFGPQCYHPKTVGDFEKDKKQFLSTFKLVSPYRRRLDDDKSLTNQALSTDFLRNDEKILAGAGIILTFDNPLSKVCLGVNKDNDIVAMQRLILQIVPLLKNIPSPYMYEITAEGKTVPARERDLTAGDMERLFDLLRAFIARRNHVLSPKPSQAPQVSEAVQEALGQCLWDLEGYLTSLHLDEFPHVWTNRRYAKEIYQMLRFLHERAVDLI